MRIEQVELYNFGSYKGLNTINAVGETPAKRIVVIGGKNGAGKTTLFTAILVCLYGHLAFGYKTAGKLYFKEVYNLVNNEARIDDAESAYVRIRFCEDRIDTVSYEVARLWNWSNGALSETIEVTRDHDVLDANQISEFNNYLVHLIPPDLLSLYFFDGEKIADYFLDTKQNNLKEALLILSGNDTYEILLNVISKLLDDPGFETDHLAHKYADQKDAYRRICMDEQLKLAEVNETASIVERTEADINAENEAYSKIGGVSLEEWKKLQNDLRDEEVIREHINLERKNAATEVLPFLIMNQLFSQLRVQVERENALRAFCALEKVLDTPAFTEYMNAHRVCDSATATDSIGIVKSYLRLQAEEADDLLFDLSEDEVATVLSTIVKAERFPQEAFTNFQISIDESIARSRTLRQRLQESTVEHFQEHSDRVASLTGELERLRYQCNHLMAVLSAIQNEKSELEKQLALTRGALEGIIKKKSVGALADKMLLLVEELQGEQYSRLLKAVEQDLNEKFFQLLRKDAFVDHIYIDPDFSLHVVRNQEIDVLSLKETARKHGAAALKNSIGRIGYERLISMMHTTEEQLGIILQLCSDITIVLPIELDPCYFSNGEKQILVMSLYWAIMKQSHTLLPFIIDTPFARIDTDHRAKITENFFKELPGQMFILSTNEELKHEHLAALDQQIAKVFMLTYSADKRTTITEGEYFGD